MQNVVTFSEEKGILTARLCGEIDHHVAKNMRECIDARLFACRPEILVMNFSGVKFMDSSGIALIIGRNELSASLGIALRLSGLSELHKRLLRLSGVERLKNLSIM